MGRIRFLVPRVSESNIPVVQGDSVDRGMRTVYYNYMLPVGYISQLKAVETSKPTKLNNRHRGDSTNENNSDNDDTNSSFILKHNI